MTSENLKVFMAMMEDGMTMVENEMAMIEDEMTMMENKLMVMIKGTYEILKKKALPSTPFHLQFRVANTPSKGKCQLFPFFEFRMSSGCLSL